jgi:hypothetical protein
MKTKEEINKKIKTLENEILELNELIHHCNHLPRNDDIDVTDMEIEVEGIQRSIKLLYWVNDMVECVDCDEPIPEDELIPWRYEGDILLCENCTENRDNEEQEDE